MAGVELSLAATKLLRPAAMLSLLSRLAKNECAYWPHIWRPATTDLTAQRTSVPNPIRTIGVFLDKHARTRSTNRHDTVLRGNGIAPTLISHLCSPRGHRSDAVTPLPAHFSSLNNTGLTMAWWYGAYSPGWASTDLSLTGFRNSRR